MDVVVILSVAILVGANLMVWVPSIAVRWLTFTTLGVGIAVSLLCIASPFSLIQAFGSCFAPIGLCAPRYGRTLASLITVAACCMAWAFLGCRVTEERQKIDNLRAVYPLVSVEDRLPLPHYGLPVAYDVVAEVERVMLNSELSRNQSRDFESLHNDHAKSFADLPGFGPSRMPPLWFESRMRRNTVSPEPIPQPGRVRDDLDPTGDALPDAKVRNFFGFHAGSIGNFVNFKGFGYVRSRREVAGFTPHAFESEPKPQVPYTLERLELVGLVRNQEPAVYVSEFLPRMAELGTLATRPADGFEAAGLKRLAAGEDLVANAVGSKVRLLGAIRNMTACVECHGGQRGDLLGAFSYRLAEAK